MREDRTSHLSSFCGFDSPYIRSRYRAQLHRRTQLDGKTTVDEHCVFLFVLFIACCVTCFQKLEAVVRLGFALFIACCVICFQKLEAVVRLGFVRSFIKEP